MRSSTVVALVIAATLLLVVGLLVYDAGPTVSPVWSKLDDRAKWVRATYKGSPDRSICIGWSGEAATLYYGTADHGTDYAAYSQSKSISKQTQHVGEDHYFVELQDLEPGTLYYMVLRYADDATSDRYTFRTLSNDPNEPIAFVSGGDSRQQIPVPADMGGAGCWNDNCRRTRQDINVMVGRVRPDFIAFTGDYVRGFDSEITVKKAVSVNERGAFIINGRDTTLDLQFEGNFEEQVSILKNQDWANWLDDWELVTAAANGRLIPVLHTLGNHEQAADLVKLFHTDTTVYYATNFGGSLFRLYTLNSEFKCQKDSASHSNDQTADGTPCKASPCDTRDCVDEVQRDWLRQDLAQHHTGADAPRWKIVQYHRPMVPQAHYCPRKDLIRCWTPLFEEYGVRLVCESHAHILKTTYPLVYDPSNEANLLQRNDAKGAVFIGDGSWGAPIRNTFQRFEGITRDAEATSGVFFIHINQQRIQVNAIVPYAEELYNLPAPKPQQESQQGTLLPEGIPLWRVPNGSEELTIQPAGQE